MTSNYYRRLYDLRIDHDLTQKDVSTYLGMSQPQYYRYERGYRDIPTHVRTVLAKLYDTSVDYILAPTDVPQPHREHPGI